MSSRSAVRPDDVNTVARTESSVIQSPNGRLLRTSTIDNDTRSVTNTHLQLKNHRPQWRHNSDSLDGTAVTSVPSTNVALPTILPASSSAPSSSFFVMVTGTIECALSNLTNEHLYCRYTFSHGPDWEVVHGVSMGLSQIGRQGLSKMWDSDDKSHVIVWNFPLEISFQSTNPYGWPRLAISIYGFDFLGRDVLRGYSGLLIPVNPGRHVKYIKTFRPVSGGRCQQLLNWLMGTNPEYYDSRMVTRSNGRGVTRVVSEDGMVVKVNLFVSRKDFTSFGYSSGNTSSPTQ